MPLARETRMTDGAFCAELIVYAKLYEMLSACDDIGPTERTQVEILKVCSDALVYWFEAFFVLEGGADIYMHHDPNATLCAYFRKLPGELIIAASKALSAKQVAACSSSQSSRGYVYFAWCAREDITDDIEETTPDEHDYKRAGCADADD